MQVWVTRDESEGGSLAAALRAAGLDPVCEPVIGIRPIGDAREEVEALSPEDWLVLTSPRAVSLVHKPDASSPKIAVVGESSARSLEAAGLSADYVAPGATAAELWDHVRAAAQGRGVCFPRSSLAAVPSLPGVTLIAPIIYEVSEAPFRAERIAGCDLVSFTSPSAVRSVARRLGSIPLPAATIGPSTSRAVIGAGGRVSVEARERSLSGLAAAIASLG